MVLDHLPSADFYAQLHIPLDRLLSTKPLYKEAMSYLVACKVEGKSPLTLKLYTRVLAMFLKYNNSAMPTANEIRMWQSVIQDTGIRPHSQHTYYRTLKRFFSWLVGEKILKESPMASMKAPILPKLILVPLSPDDIKKILTVVSGESFIDIRNRALILAFLDTGVRLAEMAGIQLSDIDLDNESVKVRGKGSKERLVRIGITAQKALLSYMMRRNDSHTSLWVTEERQPLTRDGIQICVKRIMKLAGVTSTKKGVHTFRHTAAISYLRNGGDVFTLQQLLGHSTLEMTRKYVSSLGYLDVARVHKLASPVDNMFGKKK